MLTEAQVEDLVEDLLGLEQVSPEIIETWLGKTIGGLTQGLGTMVGGLRRGVGAAASGDWKKAGAKVAGGLIGGIGQTLGNPIKMAGGLIPGSLGKEISGIGGDINKAFTNPKTGLAAKAERGITTSRRKLAPGERPTSPEGQTWYSNGMAITTKPEASTEPAQRSGPASAPGILLPKTDLSGDTPPRQSRSTARDGEPGGPYRHKGKKKKVTIKRADRDSGASLGRWHSSGQWPSSGGKR